MTESSPVPPRRVLIVDDEPLVRWAVGESLRAAGYAVVEAGALADAWPVVANHEEALDVAILDVCLPDGNGRQLLTRVMRQRPGCAVIMISAYWGAHEAASLLQRGARHVVAKPFDVSALVGMVGRCGFRSA